MSLFDGFKKKKENSMINNVKESKTTAKNPVSVSSEIVFFKKGDRSIINSVSSVMINVLRMVYIQYKYGEVTQKEISKTPTYLEIKEFEELLLVLGKTKTHDGTNTYLQLSQELLCPPAGTSLDLKKDYSAIFKFAKQLTESENPDCQEFESVIKQRIADTPNRNYSPITPHKDTVEYNCPVGRYDMQDINVYQRRLRNTINNVTMDSNISNWFRYYYELTPIGFEYAQKLMFNGQIITDWSRLPRVKGYTNQAFIELGRVAVNAGIVAGKEYCEQKGNVEAAKAKISNLTKDQIADLAASVLGFSAGNDQKYTAMLSTVFHETASFVLRTRANPAFFIASRVLSLSVLFEFGTGLYFEY